jgi:type II secretory pathway component PulF
MTYKYTAYTTDKKIVHGTLDVASESVAESALYHAGYDYILSLRKLTPSFSLERLLPTLFGVKTQEVIDFANQLATLVESGISILISLDLLAGQASKKALKKVITGLAEEIREGGSLSQALGHYPRVFPETYRQVIKASEQTGSLETGLKYAASYTEKQATANQKIKRAMMYPAFVLLMAVAVAFLLITVALPPLVNLFESLNADLPWTTKLLIGITSFLFDYKLYVLGGIVLLIMSIVFLLRLPSVKIFRDSFILKIPIIGTISLERGIQHFCQTASMLLKAGLRLPPIMDIIIQANRNRIIRQAMEQVRDRLVQGEGLSQPMSEIALFPTLLVEMTAVGEKTGAMDTTLATLADFYEKKIDRNVDTLITMIEPALTVMVGLVVLFIALSVITPLYTILQSMR